MDVPTNNELRLIPLQEIPPRADLKRYGHGAAAIVRTPTGEHRLVPERGFVEIGVQREILSQPGGLLAAENVAVQEVQPPSTERLCIVRFAARPSGAVERAHAVSIVVIQVPPVPSRYSWSPIMNRVRSRNEPQ